MTFVNDILQIKGHEVQTTTPDTLIYEALRVMADNEVGALPVIERGKLVGIISERDYARQLILKGKSSLNTPVSEIMTKQVVCVRPENTTEECMALMTDKRVRHLPVLVNDDLVGIISIGDVVKEIIGEQKMYIRNLQNYIEGRGYGQ